MPDLALGLTPTLALLVLLSSVLAGLTGVARLLARRVRWCWILPAMAIGLLAALPRLFGGEVLAPAIPLRLLPGHPEPTELHPSVALNDVLQQLLPWEIEVRRALADGAPPFWSFRLGSGESLWANPQARVLSLVAVLARPFPLHQFLLVVLVLQCAIAALGTAALASRLGARGPLALAAGAIFALGGGMMAWALFPISSTLCWAPWLSLALLSWVRDGRRGSLAATVVAATLVLLGGHPETAAFVGLQALAIALGLRRCRLVWPRTAVRVLLAGALGFGLAAPHLLPLAATVRDSRRFAEVAAHPHVADWTPGQPLVALLIDPPSWKRWIAAAGPTVFGVPYRTAFTGPFHWAEAGGGYSGLVALGGLALWLGTRRARRSQRIFGWVWLTTLLLGVGFRPLVWLLEALPLTGSLLPARAVPVGSLALALLAAFGWQQLARQPRERRPFVYLTLAAALSLALSPGLAATVVWAILLLLAAGLRWIATPGTRARWTFRQRPLLAVVALIAALELATWGWNHLPAVARSEFYPLTPPLRDLAAAATSEPTQRATGLAYAAYPNALAAYGVADVRPHNPLTRRDLVDFLAAGYRFAPGPQAYFAPFHPPTAASLARLGVRWVVLPPDIDNPFHPHLPAGLVRSPDQPLLAAPPITMPMVYAAHTSVCLDREELADWLAREEEPRRVAQLREDGCVDATTWARPTVTLAMSPNQVHIDLAPEPSADATTHAAKTLLATAIPADPGWRIDVDQETAKARPVKLYGAFLGFELAPSVRAVTLRYRPPGLAAGLVLAACSLVGLISIGRHETRRRRPASPADDAPAASLLR